MKPGHLITAPMASFLAFVTMVATQGMTGRESSLALLLGYTVIWFVLFGLAGFVPYVSTEGRESALKAFVAFGTGGAVAAAIMVYLLVTHRLGGSPTAVKLDLLIPTVLPWMLGAAVFLVWTNRE
jgi:hypothetical protein